MRVIKKTSNLSNNIPRKLIKATFVDPGKADVGGAREEQFEFVKAARWKILPRVRVFAACGCFRCIIPRLIGHASAHWTLQLASAEDGRSESADATGKPLSPSISCSMHHRFL